MSPTPGQTDDHGTVLRVLRAHPQLRNAALALSIVAIPIGVVFALAVWGLVVPRIWHWGFTPLSIKAFPAAIAAFFMTVFSGAFPVWAIEATTKVLALYAEVDTANAAAAVNRGSSEQAQVEEELKHIDTSGLVSLLRYSRVQLEAYYGIGLSQTQRSFRYSVIAMWIGFGVILAGIIVRVVDLRKFGLLPPDNNVTTLVIIAGVVIEVVSALFLWVYRSSVKQLTYFYNRQMYNHSVLMCHRIAESMTDSDDVKKAIVEKVLDKAWALEQDALPQGASLLGFGAKGGSASST